jgi:hypothetical protein
VQNGTGNYSYGVEGVNQGGGNTGYAGYFQNTATTANYGVYSTIASIGAGYGVYGSITGHSNTGYAGYFKNTDTSTSVNYGIYTSNSSLGGYGIAAYSSSSSASNQGIAGYFEYDGAGNFSNGAGGAIYAYAGGNNADEAITAYNASTSGGGSGIVSTTASTVNNSTPPNNGMGVWGEITGASNGGAGIVGTNSATSNTGAGVYGVNDDTSNASYGTYGTSASSSGYGIYGNNSSTGYAGYFSGKVALTASEIFKGATSGTVTVSVPAVAGSTTFELPGSNGTSGYNLQTNGSGVTSWAQPAMTLISTQLASTSTSLQWTGLGSSYNTYMLDCNGLTMTTSGVSLEMQVGEGATPTWENGAHYAYSMYANGSSSSATTGTSILLASALAGTTSVAEAAGTTAYIRNVSNTSIWKTVTFESGYFVTSSNAPEASVGSGAWAGDAGAITALQIIPSSSTIASGQCSLYGLGH